MNQEIDYYSKFLKYKIKYLNLKSELDGGRGFRLSPSQQKEIAEEKKANRKQEKKEAREMNTPQKADAKEAKNLKEAKDYFDKKVKEIENKPRGWKSKKEKDKFQKSFDLIEGLEIDDEEVERVKKQYKKILEIVKKHSKK